MEDSLKTALKELKQNESTISMLLGSLVIIIVGVLLYNYFTGGSNPQITDSSSSTETEQTESADDGTQELPTAHVIKAGETLWSIAQQYYQSGYNWVDIAETNGLGDGNLLAIGSQISIPNVPTRIPGETPRPRAVSQQVIVSASIDGSGHTVAPGESLWSIAVDTYQDGYQWPRLFDANSDTIKNPSSLEVGQVLRIPSLE